MFKPRHLFFINFNKNLLKFYAQGFNTRGVFLRWGVFAKSVIPNFKIDDFKKHHIDRQGIRRIEFDHLQLDHHIKLFLRQCFGLFSSETIGATIEKVWNRLYKLLFVFFIRSPQRSKSTAIYGAPCKWDFMEMGKI